MAEAAGPRSPHIELARYPQRARSGVASVARFRGCVESAIAAAVVKVDRPELTTYHLARSKVPCAAQRDAHKGGQGSAAGMVRDRGITQQGGI